MVFLLVLLFAPRAAASGFCEVNDPGSAAFIRNEYVEFGLGSEGAFGEGSYPAGWHYRSNTGQLGFVANPQANGWTSYYGDFFSPGSPLEGWGIEVGGVSYTNFNGSGGISGTLGDPACEIDICGNLGGAVDWVGALGDLGIATQYGVVNDNVYIVMTVTLTNTGTGTLSDVYWFRNVDPDNSVMTTYDYSTTNTIISQPSSSTDLAEVRASGGDGADLYLLASDSRARVSHGGFYNTDASDIWNGTGFYSTIGDSVSDDAAISIAVRVGDMSPGQTETFRVVYALDETAITAATTCAEAPVEPDADGDGIPDTADTCPSDAANDADADGICGDVDVCAGFDDNADMDGDAEPDGCDACPVDPLNDADGDGVCGDLDACEGYDDLADIDGDGTADGCDICIYDPLNDADGDSACAEEDICPGGDDFTDTDGDFVPDACDGCPDDALGDSDADGSCDSDDICPGADDTLDTDGDLIPNGCDTCPDDVADDSDVDGSCDSSDICPGWDDTADVDADGLPDDCDACPNDPLNDVDGDDICGDVDSCPEDALDDRDGDGLCESLDECPLDADNDIDGDGVCGDVDACPLIPYESHRDFDADGAVDECDDDADNDGVFVDVDCDDLDGSAGTATAWYLDYDRDGYGDAVTSVITCAQPPSYVALSGDCEDAIAEAYPGAPEGCTDALDLNCDGAVSFSDADFDGVCDDEDPCPSVPGSECPEEPEDTGDSGVVVDTDTDTAVDTATDTATVDTGDSAEDTGTSPIDTGLSVECDTATQVVYVDEEDPEVYSGGWGCEVGAGQARASLVLSLLATILSIFGARRAPRT